MGIKRTSKRGLERMDRRSSCCWTEKTSNIISCGASDNGEEANYGFDVNVYRLATALDTEPGGVVGFMFCSYTDSFSEQNF